MGRAVGRRALPLRSDTRSRRGRRFVERHNRRTRWFHTATYATVLVLLGTGWWLLGGREGQPTPVARLTGVPDATLHTWTGWVLVAVTLVGLTLGVRAARTFLASSVRFRRDDLRWFARWPAATVTGRFRPHDGHFDPGQRVANLLLVGLLVVLVVSGAGLAVVLGGPAFVWLHRLHVWATWAVTPVLVGHVLIASGLLPGYRGVARSMLGGRLRVEVARRLWPGWLARLVAEPGTGASWLTEPPADPLTGPSWSGRTAEPGTGAGGEPSAPAERS